MRALVVLLLSAPQAQAFEIDYPALFAHHADRVVQATPDQRILELPGPVIVTDYDGMYTATDQSAWGGAGCAVDRVLEIAAAVQMCPAVLGETDRAALSRLAVFAAGFFAANTYPSIDNAALPDWLTGALDERRARLDPALCDDPDAPWTGFASYLASPSGQTRMGQVLETPRLPVMHPCP